MPVSFEDVRKNDVAYEAQIQEAEEELSKLGYPRAAVFRQPVIWGDHDQFEHGMSLTRRANLFSEQCTLY